MFLLFIFCITLVACRNTSNSDGDNESIIHAIKSNCCIDNARHRVMVDASGEKCYRAMYLYCDSLRKTKNDWYTLACLGSYASGSPLNKPSANLYYQILMENNVSPDKYWDDERRIEDEEIDDLISKELLTYR